MGLTRSSFAGGQRGRCDEECIRRIAARLCRLDDHTTADEELPCQAATTTSLCATGCCGDKASVSRNLAPVTVDQTAGCEQGPESTGCCPAEALKVPCHGETKPTSCEASIEQGCSGSSMSQSTDEGPTGCCAAENATGVAERSDACCDAERLDDMRASATNGSADTCQDLCCGPRPQDEKNLSRGCATSCCDGRATEDGPAGYSDCSAGECQDLCCASGSQDEETFVQGCAADCCNDGDMESPDNQQNTPGPCDDDCCELLSNRTADIPASACSRHLKAAFERFEATLQRGLCLCQAVVKQLDFCCCSVNPDGQIGRPCTSLAGRHQTSEKISGNLPQKTFTVESNPGSSADDSYPRVLQSKATVQSANGVDIEKVASREHVVLTVSGMTCTGCSTKMKNVLDQIPAVQNPKVTFVSGSATFELDNTLSTLNELLPAIEKKTGFKCSQVISEYQQLDIVAPAHVVHQLEGFEGVVSIENMKGEKHRVTYNPHFIGARALMLDEMRLAAHTADTGALEEKRRLMKTAWATGAAAAFTIPVAVLNWSDNPVPKKTRAIVSLILATVVQAIAIPEFYVGALKSLVFSKIVEMDMLVVISITAAYGYSVCAFGLTEAGINLEQKAFFETSSLLIALVLLGRLLAAAARTRAVSAVSVNSLQAVTTLLMQASGRFEEIDSRLLEFEDTIRVLPHTRMVTDGRVVSGISAVDESAVTGENDPVAKKQGSDVIAGTINGYGPLDIQISRLVGANSINDISRLVQNALDAKVQVQDLADKVASWFIPVVVGIATIVFAIWIGVAVKIRHENAGGAIGTAITYAIAVLAISCPCALGLAVPMVLVIAGGIAARAGVVIKSANALESGFKVTDVVFDKTGTLTNGDLRVASLDTPSGTVAATSHTLGLLRTLVEGNDHPVSVAVLHYLEANGTANVAGVDVVRSIPGEGIEAVWNGHAIKVGNPFWLGVDTNMDVSEILGRGMTVTCMTIDAQLTSVCGLISTLRDEAATTVTNLQKRGIICHVVSGDNASAVGAVAVSLDIRPSNTASRHSPSDKQRYVQTLQEQGRVVLFCGDGTNDAVAIAQANVGVQMGRASDVTSAVADVVLLSGLDGVATLLDLSKQAFARIRFNFVWAALYNVFAILLAAGAFVKVRIEPAYAGIGEIVSVGPVILAAATLFVGRRGS